MKYMFEPLKKYADFKGRARRAEFWQFMLLSVMISIVLLILKSVVGDVIVYLDLIVKLGLLIPTVAVIVRRLHDIGKSGWFILVGLIPIIGGLILLFWYCKDSNAGDNAYGSSPK